MKARKKETEKLGSLSAIRGVAQLGSALGSGANHRFPQSENPECRNRLKRRAIPVVHPSLKLPISEV